MHSSHPPSSTPSQLGFRMPAEWEPHEATWLTWPHDPAHWPGRFEKAEPYWGRMVKELETGEDVRIAIFDDKTQASAEKHMKKAGVVGKRVHMHRIPNNWSWARDHGPIFVKNAAGDRLILDWGFNGWGKKWKYDLDDDMPRNAGEISGIPVIDIPMILEGGSIDVNGKGTLLTTTSCLLNPNRNPDLSQAQIEQTLKENLGVTHVLWLEGEIEGDDTNGHIDDQARFIGPKTVVAVTESNPKDSNYKSLQNNIRQLKTTKDQDGQPLEIIEIPMPKPVIYNDIRLPLSYVNFYIGNDVVLLPVFDDPNDKYAIEALQHAFPNRRIAAIDSKDLFWGFGAFHCVTQQMPL